MEDWWGGGHSISRERKLDFFTRCAVQVANIKRKKERERDDLWIWFFPGGGRECIFPMWKVVRVHASTSHPSWRWMKTPVEKFEPLEIMGKRWINESIARGGFFARFVLENSPFPLFVLLRKGILHPRGRIIIKMKSPLSDCSIFHYSTKVVIVLRTTKNSFTFNLNVIYCII